MNPFDLFSLILGAWLGINSLPGVTDRPTPLPTTTVESRLDEIQAPKGRIKSYQQTVYDWVNYLQEWVPSRQGRLSKYYTGATYNRQGQQTESWVLKTNGEKDSRQVFHYDAQFKMVQGEVYWEGPEPEWVDTYHYDAQGRLVKIHQVDWDQTKSQQVYTYQDSLLKSIISGRLDENSHIPRYRKEFIYNEQGKKIQERWLGRIYRNRKYIWRLWHITEFNLQGQAIQRRYFEEDQSCNFVERWTYLKNGEVDSLVWTYYKDGSQIAPGKDYPDWVEQEVNTYQYSYDRKGNWTEKTWYWQGQPTGKITRKIKYYFP